MENTTRLLPRESYYSKIRAAVEALKGTDCLLIARTNADPENPEEFEEGCTRMRESMEMGADMAMIVKAGNYEEAKFMAERVPGWKIFADVRADNGIPSSADACCCKLRTQMIWGLLQNYFFAK